MTEKFTFYPKDWAADIKIFELTLEERGLYFELILLAYQNGNIIEENFELWARLFNSDSHTLKTICNKLFALKLITVKKGTKRNANRNAISIPSVGKRLSKREKAKASADARWDKERNAKRNANRNANINRNIKKKSKPKKEVGFQPPTHSEVLAYMTEKNYVNQAQKFIDFYESKGWMVGKNKMKDWKAAVRSNWSESNKPKRERPKKILG